MSDFLEICKRLAVVGMVYNFASVVEFFANVESINTSIHINIRSIILFVSILFIISCIKKFQHKGL